MSVHSQQQSTLGNILATAKEPQIAMCQVTADTREYLILGRKTAQQVYKGYITWSCIPRGIPENICSEDDLRSKLFGTFVVKFLAYLPLLGFSNN